MVRRKAVPCVEVTGGGLRLLSLRARGMGESLGPQVAWPHGTLHAKRYRLLQRTGRMVALDPATRMCALLRTGRPNFAATWPASFPPAWDCSVRRRLADTAERDGRRPVRLARSRRATVTAATAFGLTSPPGHTRATISAEAIASSTKRRWRAAAREGGWRASPSSTSIPPRQRHKTTPRARTKSLRHVHGPDNRVPVLPGLAASAEPRRRGRKPNLPRRAARLRQMALSWRLRAASALGADALGCLAAWHVRRSHRRI